VVVSAFGSSKLLLVLTLGWSFAPIVSLITRAAALEVVHMPYVEAARARGESSLHIMVREILPNVRTPLLVNLGLTLTGCIVLVASLSFLGLGLQPPAADWGLMVGENRVGVTVQPWAVVAPVVAIALVTVGLNLALDGYRRRSGMTFERGEEIAGIR
jgi:peptide/nickel transport system permease protein